MGVEEAKKQYDEKRWRVSEFTDAADYYVEVLEEQITEAQEAAERLPHFQAQAVEMQAALAESQSAVKNHTEALSLLQDANMMAEALLMALDSIGARLGLGKAVSPKVVMAAFEGYCNKAEAQITEANAELDRVRGQADRLRGENEELRKRIIYGNVSCGFREGNTDPEGRR